MFRGLPTASIPLIKLFDSPYLFTVPAYQRPYSWTTKEAGQLLEDLVIAAGLDDHEAASPDYFLGNILLLDPEAEGTKPPPPFSGTRVFEIVDGQQRLITLSILASVLRDREELDAPHQGEDAEICDRLHAMVCVKPGERDITTRQSRVQLRDGEQGFLQTHVLARNPRPPIQDDDLVPKAIGIRTVQEHLAGEIEVLSGVERRKLCRYLMDDCHVVVIISRDIDRAHRLFTVLNERGKPLERQDIIKAEVLRTIPAKSAASALARWDEAHAELGEEFETFLGYMRLIHGLQRLPIISGVRTLVREYGSERFINEQLSPLAKAFNSVRTFAGSPESRKHPRLAASLISLNRLGKADWVAPAILAMTHFKQAPARATQLMIEIERFAYLLRLLGYGAGKRQRRFGGVIEDIRSESLQALTGPAWEISRDEQRTISFHLKDLHKRNTAMSKLVLMRLEDELSGIPLANDPAELTVEHILPMRPAATSDWKRQFPDAELRAECQSSLGNLALVTMRQNDRAKNKDFLDKLTVYREFEPNLPPLVSNADILNAQVWRPDNIQAREARLLSVVARIWRLDLGPPTPTPTSIVRIFG